jgi:hypothetical protein
MIDRDARKDLTSVVRRYLNEELTAFEFDEELDHFCNSADTAVRYVAKDLWKFYDDCDDHLVVLSKAQWNYFQRLLLLLESDYLVSVDHRREWALSQLYSALLLLCCVCVMLRTGIGYHLLLWFFPFGAVSLAIARLRRPINDSYPYHAIVTPFNTLHDLWAACEATGFRKERYPSHLAARAIRSPVMDKAQRIFSYVVGSCFALTPLLVQCMPTTISEVQGNLD